MSVTPYVFGDILGRLTFSWALVAFIYLLVYRFRWKTALKRCLWPWGWIWVLLVFAVGMLGNIVHG